MQEQVLDSYETQIHAHIFHKKHFNMQCYCWCFCLSAFYIDITFLDRYEIEYYMENGGDISFHAYVLYIVADDCPEQLQLLLFLFYFYWTLEHISMISLAVIELKISTKFTFYLILKNNICCWVGSDNIVIQISLIFPSDDILWILRIYLIFVSLSLYFYRMSILGCLKHMHFFGVICASK